MENIYAVMILHNVGNEVNETSVKRVLEAANAKVDKIRIKALINSLEGVDIEKAISSAVVIEQPKVEQKVEEKKEIVIETPVEDKREDGAKGLDRLFNF